MCRYSVYLGRHSRLTGGSRYDVAEVLIHPLRDKKTHDHDIMIITVTPRIVYTPSIQPVSLPNYGERPFPNDKVT